MTSKLRVLMTAPGGGTLTWGCHVGLAHPTSGKYHVEELPSLNSGGNFNTLWCRCLLAGLRKEFDFAVMLHADVEPQPGWVDILADECVATDADLVSATIPLKGTQGYDMTAIGHPLDPWNGIVRAFTQAELEAFPETFTAEDVGYKGFPLFHGLGCFVVDLRKPVWYRLKNGEFPVYFHYRERVVAYDDGVPVYQAEGEDWNFCRMLWNAGGRNVVTRKLKLGHTGKYTFWNYGGWGVCKHDERTRENWDHDGMRGIIAE